MASLGLGAAVVAGLAVGTAFVIILSLFSATSFQTDPGSSEVVIVEGASLETFAPGYDPELIKVKIGVNNTVRWINQDTVAHGIPTPDNDSEIEFFRAVEEEKKAHQFLLPGDSFQYAFTKSGEFEYHMEPHPWMKGEIIVLPAR